MRETAGQIFERSYGWRAKFRSLFVASCICAPAVLTAQTNVVVGGELQIRADNGDVKSAYTLGMRYFLGEHIVRNREMALHYLTRAAEGGDFRAMNMLGLMSDPLWSDDPQHKNLEVSVGWYRRAALQGYEPALANLAELKKRGFIESELETGLPDSRTGGRSNAVAQTNSGVTSVGSASVNGSAAAQGASQSVATSTAGVAEASQTDAVGAASPLSSIAGTALNLPTPKALPVEPSSQSQIEESRGPLDGRDVFKMRSSALVEILGDGQYASGVILGTLYTTAASAMLRTALQDLTVSYPFMAAPGKKLEATDLPSGAYLVVISNAHVMEGARTIEVGYGVDPRGQTMFKRGVAGVCFPSESGVDLALFFVPVDANELALNGVISAAPLPPPDMLAETGSRIYAIANPERMARSIAQGLISGLRPDLLQFDAPISKGSSGGAIFNESGQLLGIIFGYLNEAGAQNINFAIPLEYIRPLMMGGGALCYRASKSSQETDKTQEPAAGAPQKPSPSAP
jgi:S1-C subfamily serine protease